MGERLAIGLMTGTSIDGVDAAAVVIDGHGLGMRAKVIGHDFAPLGDLAVALRALASGERMAAGEVAQMALELGTRLAEAAGMLAMRLGRGAPALIAAHGQTVFHDPPRSWQLINAAPIAKLGCPVVFDLRAADLAAGGQGAPITPLADFVFFRDESHGVAVVNLGGFCNVTVIPERAGRPLEDWSGEVEGMDVCACNHVLDAVARRALARPFDENGGAAASGTAHEKARDELAAALRAQAGVGRSLGSGDEAGAWVDRWSDRMEGKDLAASAAEAVGAVIGGAVKKRSPKTVMVAGGGAHHARLVEAIGRACGAKVERTDIAGVPIGAREAASMAALGALCADGVAITLPRVTGVSRPAPLSGVWTGVRPLMTED